jgi:HNH endonuclease
MNGEVRRDVPSVPGILMSSEGRVMYAPHRKPMPHGGERSYGGQPTFGVWNKTDGRFIIVIHERTYKIHRLITEAFHGPPPFDNAVAMHVDENAANNRPSNLRWGTQKREPERRGVPLLLPQSNRGEQPDHQGAAKSGCVAMEDAQPPVLRLD